MLANNIRTLIYSIFNGKRIGVDNNGNKFYVHKKNKNKKWVLYKKNIDPTILDIKWQIWLTTKNFNEKQLDSFKIYNWQKKKKANATGTKSSYHPGKHNEDKILNSKFNDKSQIWEPENEK